MSDTPWAHSDVQAVEVVEPVRPERDDTSFSVSWYRSIFDESLDGILLVTDDGRILAANPALCELLGYSETELRHLGRAGITDVADARLQSALEERRTSGRFQGTVTLIARDRRRIPVDLSARVFTAQNGEKITIIFVRDATERLRTEAMLRESEERFRITLRNSPTNVFTADADLRYTWVYNPPRLLPNENIIGRRDDEILPPEQVADLIAAKREVIETGRSVRREVRVVVRNEERLYDMSIEPVFDADGKVTGLTAAATDITERWRHEQERAQLLQVAIDARAQAELDAERARHATQLRDTVLRIVSHDLRSPLTAIAMAVDAVARETPATRAESLEWLIETTRPAVSHMQRLIADLLDTASIEAGRLALQCAPTDLNLLLARAAKSFAARCGAAGIELHYEVANDLPRANVDGERIIQVVDNLLSNALNAIGGPGSISIAARHERNFILVSVRDTGPGISPQDVPYIFEPYWRRRGARAGGVGLGLSISRSIILAHGGGIWVDTAERQGATFTFMLPTLRS